MTLQLTSVVRRQEADKLTEQRVHYKSKMDTYHAVTACIAGIAAVNQWNRSFISPLHSDTKCY